MGDVLDLKPKLADKVAVEPTTALATEIVNLIANRHPPVQAEEGFAALVLAARVLHKQLIEMHGKDMTIDERYLLLHFGEERVTKLQDSISTTITGSNLVKGPGTTTSKGFFGLSRVMTIVLKTEAGSTSRRSAVSIAPCFSTGSSKAA